MDDQYLLPTPTRPRRGAAALVATTVVAASIGGYLVGYHGRDHGTALTTSGTPSKAAGGGRRPW